MDRANENIMVDMRAVNKITYLLLISYTIAHVVPTCGYYLDLTATLLLLVFMLPPVYINRFRQNENMFLLYY